MNCVKLIIFDKFIYIMNFNYDILQKNITGGIKMVTIGISNGKQFDLSNEREMRNISHDDAEKVVDYIRTTVSYSDESMYLRPISESATFLSKLSLEKLKSVFSMAKRIAGTGNNEVLENLCNQGAAVSRLDNAFLRDIKENHPAIDTKKLEKIVFFRTNSFDSYLRENKSRTDAFKDNHFIPNALSEIVSITEGAERNHIISHVPGMSTLLGVINFSAIGFTVADAIIEDGRESRADSGLIRHQCHEMATTEISDLARFSSNNKDVGAMLDRVTFRSQFCQFLRDYPLDRLTSDNGLGNIPFRTDEIVDLAIKLADETSDELYYKDSDPLKNICKNQTMNQLPNLEKLFKFCKNRDEINLLADNPSLESCKPSEIAILRDVPNAASNDSRHKIEAAYQEAYNREKPTKTSAEETKEYVQKELKPIKRTLSELTLDVRALETNVKGLQEEVLENAENIGLNADNITKLGALVEKMSKDVGKLSDNQENHKKILQDLQESFKELDEIISDPNKKEALQALLSSETIDREFNDDLMVIQDEIASKIDSSQYPKAAEQIQEFAVSYKAALSKLYDVAPLTLGDTMPFSAGKKAKRIKLAAQMVGGASAIAAEAGGAKGVLAGAGGLLIGSKLSQLGHDESKKVVSSMTALGKIVDGSDDDPTRRTPTQQRNIAMKVINLHVMQMAEHFASHPRKIQQLSAGLVDAKKSGANYHRKVVEAFNGIADNINLINQGTASATSGTSRILHNSRNKHPQIAEITVSSPLEEAASRMTAAALTSNIPSFFAALRPHASHSEQEAAELALAFNILFKADKGTLRGTMPATVTNQPPTSPERRARKIEVAKRTIARHSQSTTGVFNNTRIG